MINFNNYLFGVLHQKYLKDTVVSVSPDDTGLLSGWTGVTPIGGTASGGTTGDVNSPTGTIHVPSGIGSGYVTTDPSGSYYVPSYGGTSFGYSEQIDALRVLFHWDSSGGGDLDIIMEMAEPAGTGKVGFAVGSTTDVLRWGGDVTTHGGTEIVLVDMKKLQELYPNRTVMFDLKAHWYSTRGTGETVFKLGLAKGDLNTIINPNNNIGIISERSAPINVTFRGPAPRQTVAKLLVNTKTREAYFIVVPQELEGFKFTASDTRQVNWTVPNIHCIVDGYDNPPVYTYTAERTFSVGSNVSQEDANEKLEKVFATPFYEAKGITGGGVLTTKWGLLI